MKKFLLLFLLIMVVVCFSTAFAVNPPTIARNFKTNFDRDYPDIQFKIIRIQNTLPSSCIPLILGPHYREMTIKLIIIHSHNNTFVE